MAVTSARLIRSGTTSRSLLFNKNQYYSLVTFVKIFFTASTQHLTSPLSYNKC